MTISNKFLSLTLHLLLLLLLATASASASALPSKNLRKRQHRPAHYGSEAAASWNSGAVHEFQLHESCNETQTNQLRFAFEETAILAAHARDHVLRFGNESEVYQKYFGGYPPFEIVGAFSMVVNGDKADLLFRCDDPDGNCAANEDWGGHWRGENASLETVICETSFQERRELSQVCALGYNVAESNRLIFWASDILHRLFHLPTIGYGYIEHYADGYEEIVTASEMGNANITHDTDALQYFALEAWAHDIAVPGVGCPGPAPDHGDDEDHDDDDDDDDDDADETSMATMSMMEATMTEEETTSMSPSTAEAEAEVETETEAEAEAEAETEASENCHTHSDGEVHCE